MSIPKITKQNVLDAMKYIDEKGMDLSFQSYKYDLVTEDGKIYSPKYVIAIANHIAKGDEISTENFTSVEAKNFLEGLGFKIEIKQQEKFELVITADEIKSTDERFSMDNLYIGDNYKPLDTYFQKADGTIIRRLYRKAEKRNCNQTMPRIACQVFEKQIDELPVNEKKNFPVCRYKGGELFCGIFSSVDEFKMGHGNTLENMTYTSSTGKQFVFYCWNIFSTILFVQECLKRFGEKGDKFVLIYREKGAKESQEEKKQDKTEKNISGQNDGYRNPYSAILLTSKNLILHGAPGTGKSHLAKEIAADIVSNGYYDNFSQLNDEQKKQVEFVQFHPSYDYSDFVEGLRPKLNADGTMGFELQDGIFKNFVARARKNFEDSKKSRDEIGEELSVQEAIAKFFSSIEFGKSTFKTLTGNEFIITDANDMYVYIYIPGNPSVNRITINLDEITKMLSSGKKFDKIKDVTAFFGKRNATQDFSYDFVLYKEILKQKKSTSKIAVQSTEQKKYVFIIDEINRGEISKIFGELFYAIEPGYRGKDGEISTQYKNLHSDPNEKFYIPENVYIIGTMNDIDRSVDSFDFAMRRRFRFVELKANEHLEMLAALEDEGLKAEAVQRMSALNDEIAKTEDLGENYQIGAAYFLKLKTLTFDQLWTDCLEPLLQEYVRGMFNEQETMARFAKAYRYQTPFKDDSNETAQN